MCSCVIARSDLSGAVFFAAESKDVTKQSPNRGVEIASLRAQ